MKKLFLSSLLLCLIIVQVFSCDVPVFRYALERWWPDSYGVFVFYKGSLSADNKKVVDWLEKQTSGDQAFANCFFMKVDVDSKMKKEVSDFWKAQSNPKLPWMVVCYPRISPSLINVWSGPFERKCVENLLISPARKEIGRRLLNEDSAVWIFLKSGDAEKDKAAKSILTDTLNELKGKLELPPGYGTSDMDGTGYQSGGAGAVTGYSEVEVGGGEAAGTNGAAVSGKSGVIGAADTQNGGSAGAGDKGVDTGAGNSASRNLPKISFSVIDVSRKDKKEDFFVKMLLGSEKDLNTSKEPMAFPVFGRGRVLYTLVGKGINKENISETCYFLVGACSCQVKGMNPGVDLLMYVDWEGGLQNETITDTELPPLPGIASLAESVKDNSGAKEKSTVEPGKQANKNGEAAHKPAGINHAKSFPYWFALVSGAAVLLILVIGTFILFVTKK